MADTQDRGNITTPDAANLNTSARKYAADQGWALPDGSYPIRPAQLHGKQDLAKAVLAIGRGNTSNDQIKRHIKKRANQIDAIDVLPTSWK